MNDLFFVIGHDSTRIERGLMWPRHDQELAEVTFRQAEEDLPQILKFCERWKVCVQAGGSVGIWAKELAKSFEAVYSFEPDPVNFLCLAHNAPETNIFKFNAALGFDRGTVDMERQPVNAGAYQVSGHGHIPVLRIDDLGLNVCDFICLDIEGCEHLALQGAVITIGRLRPLISIEDKGLSVRYGMPEGGAAKWLETTFGYRVAGRVANDTICVPG